MKQINIYYILYLLFTVLSATSCIYDDAPEIEHDNAAAHKILYMSVKLDADDNKEFNKGREDERTIENAIFFFFDNEGKQVAEPVKTTNKENGLILLEDPTNIPTRLVTIVNPTSRLKTKNLKELDIDDLKNIQGYYILNKEPDSSEWKIEKPSRKPDIFTMSNSSYVENGVSNFGTPIYTNDFYKKKEDALDNPVIIPVERVVSKIHVETKDSKNKNTIIVDGKEEEVSIEITGCWLDNMNNQSYLFKRINDNYDFIWKWNDTSNKRSYWAEPAKPYERYQHYRYSDQIEIDKNKETCELYALENTDQDHPTQLVVAARLKFKNETNKYLKNAKNHERRGLFCYKGKYYTKENLQHVLMTHEYFNQFYVKRYIEENKYEYCHIGSPEYEYADENMHFGEEYLKGKYVHEVEYYNIPTDMKSNAANKKVNELKRKDLDLKAYEIYLIPQLTESTKSIYKKEGDKYTEIDRETINEEWANNPEMRFKVKFWRQMKTYYYVPINHIKGSNKKAIIRNHLYNITIKSIHGLGTPVPDTENEIIPVTPTNDNTYIDFTIEVTPYEKITNDIVLGEE